MTQEYDKYELYRKQLIEETNAHNYTPISFEIYKKTPKEKIDLANAKARFKANNK